MPLSENLQFCKQILPEVSRTFAINISVLRGDLHKAILVAYLFCRIADTVEDSFQLSVPERTALLDSYIEMFRSGRFTEAEVTCWITSFELPRSSGSEYRLVQNSDKVFEVLQSLPDDSRQAISDCVIEMAQGMKETINRKGDKPVAALQTLAELDRYCYYVAGTVGVMLTKLFAFHSGSMSSRAIELAQKLQVSFGLGLQVTNIIKDSFRDFKRGWCYIPVELAEKEGVRIEEFFDSHNYDKSMRVLQVLIYKAGSHLDDALTYTSLIPRKEIRMRLFCLWPLFFAMKTLIVATHNHNLVTGEAPVKISRFQVYRTMLWTTLFATSNTLLKWYYRMFRKRLNNSEH